MLFECSTTGGFNAKDCIACELASTGFFKESLRIQDRMFMCLHAWKYDLTESEGLSFEAPMPKWARDLSYVDFVFDRRRRDANKGAQ